MDELIDTGQWVEMAYNGRNSYPITYSGYMRRKYRVSVRPDGTIRQTGTVVQDETTVLVHPEDVRKLARMVEKRQPLFTLVAPPAPPEPQMGQGLIKATETAVLLAEQWGVNLAGVTGTGPDLWITEDDVRAAIAVITGDDDPPSPPPPIQSGATPLNDLTVISGIGEKTAVKLNEAGIHSLTDLVAADSENLAATIGVNVSTVRGWQVDGRKLLAK